MSAPSFSSRVLNWYQQHGRYDLPWQKKATAYRVFVSEIMLQQTQVKTVERYFPRFITQFPNVKQLALAKLDHVLSFWSGLGYYARARNMHKTAGIIHHQYHGRFPKSVEALMELPGIGRSTAGAIISLSSNQYAVILDGNVKRVLARHAAILGWPGQKKVHDHLWKIATARTPQHEPKHYTQAMMDLGALICTRTKPQCHACPVHHDCQAFEQGQIERYPGKKPKSTRRVQTTAFLIIQNEQNHVFLEKRPAQGIWGGLWSFPECDQLEYGLDLWQRKLGSKLSLKQKLAPVEHRFSHYDLMMTPVLVQCRTAATSNNKPEWHWQPDHNALPGGIPAPIEKLLNHIRSQT